MHSKFTSTGTLQLSRISVFALMVILVGMSACGTSDTNTLAELSKRSATAAKSVPAANPGDATSETLPNYQTSETSSPGQTSDRDSSLTLAPKHVLTHAPLPDRPPIGTEIGQTLPQFEITLFEGKKKLTASLADIGQPVFLFFFTTW